MSQMAGALRQRRTPTPGAAGVPGFSLSSVQGPSLAVPGPRVPSATAAGLGAAAQAATAPGQADLRYLLQHATMGFTVGDYAEARVLGWSGWLEQQLNPQGIDDSAVDAVLAQLPTLPLTATQLYIGYQDQAVVQVVTELQYAVLLRAIYSRRQLYERLVTFWTDHLNISQLDDICLWAKTQDDREVVRAHALGTFPDLIKASAKSPAMQWYLDNYANAVGAPQENWARELLELHTLGVDGPYTEDDVKEVARCFTGWTLGASVGSPALLDFVFVPALHDFGQKTVLGQTIPAGGGISDGELVLDLLAHHPSTAEFIAGKLTRWLLMYEPPQELVRSVARTYLATGGDIPSMIRVILDPDTVARIPVEERMKLRQPLHFMIALLRSAQVGSQNLLQITQDSERVGQTPFWWPSPDGPPDSLEAWGPAVLPRWDFASRLFMNQIQGNQPDGATLQALVQTAPAGSSTAAAINWVLTGGLLSAEDEAEVQAYIDSRPFFNELVLREAFALAASSPSYQFV